MERLKTFGIYALIVIAFFFFSNIMINIALKCTYDPMDVYLSVEEGQEVTIEESKATYVNGIVEGKLKNNTETDIKDKYIKLEMYTRKDNPLGTKYIHIAYLKQGEELKFKMGFKLTNAYKAKISIIDESGVDTTNSEAFTSEELGTLAILSLIVLMCIPV